MTKITIFTKYGDVDTEVSLVRYHYQEAVRKGQPLLFFKKSKNIDVSKKDFFAIYDKVF